MSTFGFQTPMQKAKCESVFYNPSIHMKVPGACWPASLAEMMSLVRNVSSKQINKEEEIK